MDSTKKFHPFRLLLLKCYKIPAFVDVFLNDTWTIHHSFGNAGKAVKIIWKYGYTNWQGAAVLLYPAFIPDTPAGGCCGCIKRQALDGHDFNNKREFERQSLVNWLWIFVGYGIYSLAGGDTHALSPLQMV